MQTKKVLVTGADGFIGSHLTELLVKEGYDVRALGVYNSNGQFGWLDGSDCRDKVELVLGDVRDPGFCMELVKDVDIVLHLAALIAIPYSYVAPDSYIATNVTGTLNMCQAAKAHGVSRFIHTSTSEVYGTAQYVPIDEAHPLQAQSPYSASKIGADAIATSFHTSFELPLTIARPFNTYGPRQSARAVIPTIITQIAAGAKTIKLGDVSPTRDFNYVEDTARGFLALMNCDAAIGETINIGSGTEISVGDSVHLIREIMESDVTIETDEARLRPENSEVFRLCCDNRKISDLTGFVPQYDLRAGLTKTIEWFASPANLAQYDAGRYNI